MSKADCFHNVEYTSSNQLKAFRRRLTFLKEEGTLPADSLQTQSASFPSFSILPAYSADFELTRLHNGMNLFLDDR